MFVQSTSIAALAAITVLTQIPSSLAGHVRHRHGLRTIPRKDNDLEVLGRRATPGTVEVQTGSLQMLQSEITTFQGWMDTYINSTKSMDQATALAQLKQEFEAFSGWMEAFLANVLGTGPTTLPALPSTRPLTAVPETSVLAAFSSALSTAPASYSSLAAVLASSTPAAVIPSSSAVVASPVATYTSATSVIAPEKLHSSSTQPTTSQLVASSASIIPSAPAVSSPVAKSASSAPAPVSSAAVSPSSVPASESSVAASSLPAPAPSNPPSGSGGSFNAKGSNNVAVYYGQSGATSQVTLGQMCQDANVDIVILAFVTDFFGPGGYPKFNLASACDSTSPAMTAKGATGLLSCPTMAEQITSCQSAGKKVLVSLGGAIGTTAFSGDEQADQFATRLWDLFGGGNGESKDMRPFGDAKVDGFDVDNEDHSTAHYSAFVTSLRSKLNSDTSKTYYISAAPQCPIPDESIPLDAMQSMDFVFVQFYNNAQANCDVGQSGFVDSFKAWSQNLSAKGNGPKIYVGAPGCKECAGAGYVEPVQMGDVIASAKNSGVSNFGGVMLWDGPEAKGNTEGGRDYLSVVKSALA